jgi:hypothetical protein
MRQWQQFARSRGQAVGITEDELQDIIAQAKAEIAIEKRQAAIDTMKIKLARRRWWQILVPFKISITRNTHV